MLQQLEKPSQWPNEFPYQLQDNKSHLYQSFLKSTEMDAQFILVLEALDLGES